MRHPPFRRVFRGVPPGGFIRTLVQQQYAIAHVWPQLTCQCRGGRLICRGRLRPRPDMQEYMVRIEYSLRQPPRAIVESPSLECRPGSSVIPHTYPADGQYPRRPCLYYPDDLSWTPAKLIAQTITPWLLSWLVFYELWRATGTWFGGGVDHGNGGDARSDRRDEPEVFSNTIQEEAHE